MRIDKTIMKCVVFVGHKTERGFAVEGTGFFLMCFEGGLGFQQIVTARHVITSFKSEYVYIRLNNQDGTPRVLATKKSDWIFHPNPAIDVGILPIEISAEGCDVLHIHMEQYLLTKEVIEKSGVGEGDEVFIAGAYVSRVGESKNLPIVRVGNIASMAVEPVWPASKDRPAYLIEVRSLGGLSGSPVFVHLPLVTRVRGEAKALKGRHEYFLGMVLGHHVNRHDLDTILDDHDLEEDQQKTDFNTGIAVVLPADQIVEVVQLPWLVEERKKWRRST
jgi:hypothetical protein